MAKLIWRLPSKAITYGYVEVHANPEELGFEHGVTDAEVIGTVYATYVGAFLKGEKEGLDLFMRGRSESVPESLTVGQEVLQGFMGRTEHVEEAVQTVRERRIEAPPGDPEAAAQRLAEDKKPRTVDEANEMATQLIQKELGATVVSEEAPPWERKAEAKQPKPWERKTETAPSQGAAPKIADINW